ncbi:ABC transporter ATP-binding protein [Pseudonocardia sp. NPDC046786]|uniref:ABC transporter ATP-binding protein n=1 Tax=Pseudonocardia sp. NPDC046786 TaxID=3155471 RepID=UPI0033F8D640
MQTATSWAPPASVQLRAVDRTFGTGADRRVVLEHVDLDVAAGEVVALLGASGCGKSTLLRLVSGLDRPTGGAVLVDGDEVDGVERRAAVVFQEPRLLPWRSLADNVAFGVPDGTSRADRDAAVDRALDAVGLAEFARYRPRAVSGGMAQRTALARALVRAPGVLLLDEPFAALDALTRIRMQDLVDDLQQRSGATVLLVTHDVDEALQLADRIVVLGRPDDDGDGHSGAGIVHVLAPPGPRPRDRADPGLTALRADLLDRLGVPVHHTRAPR